MAYIMVCHTCGLYLIAMCDVVLPKSADRVRQVLHDRYTTEMAMLGTTHRIDVAYVEQQPSRVHLHRCNQTNSQCHAARGTECAYRRPIFVPHPFSMVAGRVFARSQVTYVTLPTG
uniref:Secreted protein n=1 Tax=Anopheles funestus TaxID=62324 RepID=A0A4Y0BH49_ANOFN